MSIGQLPMDRSASWRFGGRTMRTSRRVLRRVPIMRPAASPISNSSPTSLSNEARAELFRVARKEQQKLYTRLVRAVQEAEAPDLGGSPARGRICRAEALQRRFLSSFNVKLVFLDRANQRLRIQHRCTREELVGIAGELDLFTEIDEEVRLKARLKSSGGTRIIHSFGLRRRAAQMMVDAALRPYVPSRTDPRQKTLSSTVGTAGTHVVARDIKTSIDRGARWVHELDIANCFPSLDRSLLLREGFTPGNQQSGTEGGLPVPRRLPLPRRVIENVVLADQTNLTPIPIRNTSRPYGTHIGPLGVMIAAREGVAQGSHCSSIVAEFVIGDMLRVFPDAGVIRTFADNVFVSHEKKKMACAISTALIRVFDALSAGRIILRERQRPRKVSDGVNVLGYRIVRRMSETLIGPSRENVAKLRGKLLRALGAPGNSRVVSAAPIIKMIRQWSGAFTEWDARSLGFMPYCWCSIWTNKHLAQRNSGVARAIMNHRLTYKSAANTDVL